MRVVHMRLNVCHQIVWHRPNRKTAPVRNLGDSRSDVSRDLADPRQCGIEAPLLDISYAHQLRQHMRRGHEHLVSHQPCAARDRTKTDAWKDIRIIPLARHEHLAVERYPSVRDAAGGNRTTDG